MKLDRSHHALVFVLLCALLLWTSSAEAQQVSKTRRIDLTVGKSVVINTGTEVTRVSVGSPEIADVQALSPTEVYIVGKRPGSTNVTMWHEEGQAVVVDVSVGMDVAELKRKLYQILPEETGIKVIATNNRITLSGTVRNAAALGEAVALAECYLPPEGKVNNLLTVAGGHQVMLEVKIAEMSKSLIKRLGMNFSWNNDANFGIGLMGGLVDIVQPPIAEIALGPLGAVIAPAPQVNGLLRFNSGSSSFSGFFDVLKSNGAVKILAEPNLIAMSGQTASFLAGGEYPVPVPAGNGDVAIVYKPYGVFLQFTPVVQGDDRISIKVKPEVSEIDFSVAVTIAGATVPGVTTRKAETLVELADGQSFAIAGLLRDTSRETVSKNPVLGDIPIIGALFKSKSFQQNETELIIIVTPHLARPLDMAQQTLPTDHYIAPDDAEFYVWGIFGKSKADDKVRLDGRFGHIIE